jgi:hypothetical protein
MAITSLPNKQYPLTQGEIVNSNESSNQYSLKIPIAGEVDEYLKRKVVWLASILATVPGRTWAVFGFSFLLLSILIGIGLLLKTIAWIAVGSFSLLSICYGVCFANEFKLIGFADAEGKGQAICYLLFAGMTFWLLLNSVQSKPAAFPTVSSSQNEQATIAYWNELRAISQRCGQANEKLSNVFKGELDTSNIMNTIEQFRQELGNATGQINELSLNGVDSEVVELAVEMDAILADISVLLDDSVEFVQDNWTLPGMLKALVIGTKAEEEALTEQERRLKDRLMSWSATQTKVRSRLSIEYRKTLPAIAPPF